MGQLMAFGQMGQVGADLGLPGEAVRPARVGRERERVQVRRNVAGAAGVSVVPPGAADRGGALQDDEIGPARLAQPDARAQAADAGPDDRDPHVFRQRAGHLLPFGPASRSPVRRVSSGRPLGTWASGSGRMPASCSTPVSADQMSWLTYSVT